jgi:hypothetical protein
MDEIRNSLNGIEIVDGDTLAKVQKLSRLLELLTEGLSDEVTERAGHLLDEFDKFCDSESDDVVQGEVEIWMDSLISILEEDKK